MTGNAAAKAREVIGRGWMPFARRRRWYWVGYAGAVLLLAVWVVAVVGQKAWSPAGVTALVSIAGILVALVMLRPTPGPHFDADPRVSSGGLEIPMEVPINRLAWTSALAVFVTVLVGSWTVYTGRWASALLPGAAKPHDLVDRNFSPPAPDRLWVADFT